MNDDWQKADLVPTWDFDQKKMLAGVFIGKQDNVGRNQSTLYSIKTDEGAFTIWGSALLDSRFNSISVGEEVMVTFRGMKKSERTGRVYKDYEVLHRPVKPQSQEEYVDLDKIKLEGDSSY